jgi:hypothetical protein
MPKVRSERTNNLIIDDDGLGPPTIEGQVRNDSGDLVTYFGGQVVSLTAGGSGITPTTHRNLDQLVHDIAEDNYTEITRVAGKVTNVTVWTDNLKTTKIRETQITRTAGKVTQVVEIQYDGAGVVIVGETKTTTITRTAGKVTSLDEVMS